MRQFLRSKIHRALVTESHQNYEGSFGIDYEIMEKVGLKACEAIEIYNITSGTRLKTYAIPLRRGSKQFVSNGAAAHLVRPNELIIIASYTWLTEAELEHFPGPRIALLDNHNQIKRLYQPNWKQANGASRLEELDILRSDTSNT